MQHPLRTALRSLTALLVAFIPLVGAAQDPEAPEFEIENAVLDTSILFVTGAQEAVQELRGAFGWPTFQEGLANGIYYRFDPDGYARFAPTARLDTDVFEVICRSRTVTCMAQKGILGLNPTNTGQFQLAIQDYAEGEQFYLVEGTTEIQLPIQILDPLDTRLETLLSSNGELVIRRGAEERARVSLAGFGQTLAYLRWVAARQDYAALPQGWPVPNGSTPAPARLTAADGWANPMAQQPATASVPDTAADAVQSAEVDALRRELETLRGLISISPAAVTNPDAPMPQIATPAPVATAPIDTANNQVDVARLAALEAMVATLSAGLAAPVPCGTDPTQACPPQGAGTATGTRATPPLADLSPVDTMSDLAAAPELPPFGTPVLASAPALPAPVDGSPIVSSLVTEAVTAPPSQDDKSGHVEYLMNEIGLDAETALMVLQLGPLGLDLPTEVDTTCNDTTLSLAFSDEMTRQALADLAEPISEDAPPVVFNPVRSGTTPSSATPGAEFVLLSDYLQSIFRPVGGK